MTAPTPRTLARLCAAAALAATLCGAAAQTPLYRVTNADGTVTFTDRPPAAAGARVDAVGRSAASSAPALPPPLREAVTRFPVVLYTVPNCAPCDDARVLLRTRGIPYQERLANPESDRDAWLRAIGSLDAPGLKVGSQVLRGFVVDEWQSTLDLAGYPRESRLPAGYPTAAVTPLNPRRAAEAPPAATPETPAPTAALPPAEAPPAAGGFRF
jgi:glutaredoxin